MASPGVCMLLLLVVTTVATDMELEEISHSTVILDDTDTSVLDNADTSVLDNADTSVLDNADTTILDNADTIIPDDGGTTILDEDNTTVVGDSATIMLNDTDITFDDPTTSTTTSAPSNITTPAAPAITTPDAVPTAAVNTSTTDSSTFTTTKTTTTSTPPPNAETTTPNTTINTPTAASSEAFTKSTETYAMSPTATTLTAASSSPETASATPTADNATITLTASNPVTVPTGHSCRKPGVEYPIGISYEELREALEVGSVLLIDVRNRWELEETGRLPWSVNLPLPELNQAIHMSENDFMKKYGFPKPLPEDTNVVLTCRSGRRATVAWKQLEPLGYCNIRVYFGSYLEWKARGGPLLPVARTL